jgi:hypothetical protein
LSFTPLFNESASFIFRPHRSNAVPARKLDRLANQHLPTGNMNAVRGVGSSCRSPHADDVAHVIPARVERRRQSECVATVATFSEGPAAGAWSLQQRGTWHSVGVARARRAGGATGIQAARRSYR